MEDGRRANLADPLLRGALIELPPRGAVFVAGDLHGSHRNFERILALADLENHPERRLILQELTHDYSADDELVDRSWRLVMRGARLKAQFADRVHILLGNHEFAEVCRLPILKHGCDVNERFARGLRDAFGERAPEVFASFAAFWRSLPLAAWAPNGLFICHSTPALEKLGPLDLDWLRNTRTAEAMSRRSPAFDLIWGRDYRPETAEVLVRRMQCEVLLVGHTSCPDGWQTPNRRHVVLDGKDARGAWALLPLDKPIRQQDVVAEVRGLWPGAQAALEIN